MDKSIKNTIKRIAELDITKEVDLFGNISADILFKENQVAIYIDNEHNNVKLYLPPDLKREKKQKTILRFVELLAVFESLERENLIYVQNESLQENRFFYQTKECFEKDQLPNVYKVSKELDLNLQEEDGGLLKDGEIIMTAIAIDPHVSVPLSRLLCSSIMPTESLKKFIKRGFTSEEKRNTQLGLKYSVVSMTIAIIVAMGSPFFSVFVANRYGITTINQTQLDSLINTNKAKPVYVITQPDSLHSISEQDNQVILEKIKNGK